MVKRLLFCLFILSWLSSSGAAAGKNNHSLHRRPVAIWPTVPFVAAGDIAEFNATILQNRDSVRRVLWDEYSSVLVPVVQAGANAEVVAPILANILLAFNNQHEKNKLNARAGISLSLESMLKSEFDEMYRQFNIGDHNRRASFIQPSSQIVRAIETASEAGGQISPAIAKEILGKVDYFIFGSYTIIPNGRVELNVTIEKYLNGETRSFAARGLMEDAIKVLAQKVFSFFQANKYPEWKNPLPQLEWFQASSTRPQASLEIIKMNCEELGGRLPYARELLMASQGSRYQDGGIDGFRDGEVYAVADRKYHNKPYFYFAGQEDSSGGAVRTGAGNDPTKIKYWCVRGKPSEYVLFIENLYKIWRTSASRNDKADKKVKTAISYVLLELNEFGADPFFSEAFPDIESAIKELEGLGIKIKIPSSSTRYAK